MWRKRTALTVVMVVVAAACGAVLSGAPAWAAGRGQQVYGDVNGDDLTDRITLGLIEPDLCSVIVEYGTPSGDFRVPQAFAYLRPGGDGSSTRCPDIGVAVELDTDGRDELVVAWWPGYPTSTPYDLLILSDAFQPSVRIPAAVWAPTFLGLADFNGDGRRDVYALTDQGEGFETFINLGNGGLNQGSQRWCSGRLTYDLRDFDIDGGIDVLNAYLERCQVNVGNGVVVLDDDGTRDELQYDPTGLNSWVAVPFNANGDRFLDVRTTSRVTGDVDYFINVGDGTFVPSPRATSDTVYLNGDKAVGINVLANDYASSEAVVTIVTPPRYGTAQVTSSRTIVYRPAATHGATDSFTYQLTERGRTSRTSVYLRFTG